MRIMHILRYINFQQIIAPRAHLTSPPIFQTILLEKVFNHRRKPGGYLEPHPRLNVQACPDTSCYILLSNLKLVSSFSFSTTLLQSRNHSPVRTAPMP